MLADEQVESLTSAGETLWALTDHLGSVRDVVDNNGTLRVHRDYLGFGTIDTEIHYNASGTPVTSGSGYVDVAFRYTGRWLDDETGLQNNLNRWYDASAGRWISEDPIGFAAGDANLYRYVGNAPTGYIDPSGLLPGGVGGPSPGSGGHDGDNEESWRERRQKLEELGWWEDSGWDWLNLGAYQPIRFFINHYTGYSASVDRLKEQDGLAAANDPSKKLQAGDIETWNGGTQLGGAAQAESEIKEFGRQTTSDRPVQKGCEPQTVCRT